MIRKSLVVAAATASLAVAAASPLGTAAEAVNSPVASERRVPVHSVVESAPSPAASRTATPVKPTPSTTPSKPQAAPEAPRSAPAAPRASEPAPKPQRTAHPAPKPVKQVTTIGGYAVCNQNPQPCIDRGLTLYGQPYGAGILAGHNHMGFQWLSRQPVGRTVVVSSGPVAGTYVVTGHMRLNRQSGDLPSFGSADLVLQSCEGSGTGFSLLRRVA